MHTTPIALKTTAVLLLALLLGGCGARPEDVYVEQLELTLDGQPLPAQQVSLSCSYRDNDSLFNVGPRRFITSTTANSAARFLALDHDRVLMLMPNAWPRQQPESGNGKPYCLPPQASDWEGYLLDPHQQRLYVLSAANQAAASRLGLPALRITDGKPQAASQPLSRQAELRQQFEMHAARLATLMAEEYTDLFKDDKPNPDFADDIAFLHTLPPGQPSLILPDHVSPTALPGRREPDDWPYGGLPHLRQSTSQVSPLPLPGNPQANLVFNPLQQTSGSAEPMVYLLHPYRAPAIRIAGLPGSLQLQASALLWYPDSQRLIMLQWRDMSDRLLNGLFNHS
jgi:hypothetical protein